MFVTLIYFWSILNGWGYMHTLYIKENSFRYSKSSLACKYYANANASCNHKHVSLLQQGFDRAVIGFIILAKVLHFNVSSEKISIHVVTNKDKKYRKITVWKRKRKTQTQAQNASAKWKFTMQVQNASSKCKCKIQSQTQTQLQTQKANASPISNANG